MTNNTKQNTAPESYYHDSDPILSPDFIPCLYRLKMELSNKQYFNDSVYRIYLNENGLDPDDIYDKDTMHRKLLLSVYAVMESLANNLDIFRSVETEFGTYGEAAKALEKRLTSLKKRIDETPDNVQDKDESPFTFMYHTNKR